MILMITLIIDYRISRYIDIQCSFNSISKDDRQADAEEFTERLQKLEVPEHVQHPVDDELQKLQVLEHSVLYF